MVEYEPDEESGDIKPTSKIAKDELKAQIDFYVKERKNAAEAKPFKALEAKIKEIETAIKNDKAEIKSLKAQLELKLKQKRYGIEDEFTEASLLLESVNEALSQLEEEKKALSAHVDNMKKVNAITKKMNVIQKDKDVLEAKLYYMDALMRSIGGVITSEEAQKLILKKHFDLINEQLQRYLAAERRALIAAYENLYDKYFISSLQMEGERTKTLAEVHEFLTELKYVT